MSKEARKHPVLYTYRLFVTDLQPRVWFNTHPSDLTTLAQTSTAAGLSSVFTHPSVLTTPVRRLCHRQPASKHVTTTNSAQRTPANTLPGQNMRLTCNMQLTPAGHTSLVPLSYTAHLLSSFRAIQIIIVYSNPTNASPTAIQTFKGAN